MSNEELLLKWNSLRGKQMYYNCAEGKAWHAEAAARSEANTLLTEHETLMTKSGFNFIIDGILLPNGEIYEL